MAKRISGRSFDVTVGDLALHVEKVSLSITDNSEVAKDRGVPNGYVDGDVEASGDIELDAANLSLLSEAAKSAGSWRALEPFDLLFYAKPGNGEEMKVEAFGAQISVSDLLDIDGAGGSKHVTTVPFKITSPDFVRINGVPYLDASETEGLTE